MSQQISEQLGETAMKTAANCIARTPYNEDYTVLGTLHLDQPTGACGLTSRRQTDTRAGAAILNSR